MSTVTWLFTWFLIVVFALCFIWILLHEFRGYKRGVHDGYDLGHRDANNWWIGIEQECNGVRREIWRKEFKRG